MVSGKNPNRTNRLPHCTKWFWEIFVRQRDGGGFDRQFWRPVAGTRSPRNRGRGAFVRSGCETAQSLDRGAPRVDIVMLFVMVCQSCVNHGSGRIGTVAREIDHVPDRYTNVHRHLPLIRWPDSLDREHMLRCVQADVLG